MNTWLKLNPILLQCTISIFTLFTQFLHLTVNQTYKRAYNIFLTLSIVNTNKLIKVRLTIEGFGLGGVCL